MKTISSFLLRLSPAFLIGSAFAQEQTSALQTAATSAIASAKTASEAILVAAIGLVAGFVLYKVIKRAFNKA